MSNESGGRRRGNVPPERSIFVGPALIYQPLTHYSSSPTSFLTVLFLAGLAVLRRFPCPCQRTGYFLAEHQRGGTIPTPQRLASRRLVSGINRAGDQLSTALSASSVPSIFSMSSARACPSPRSATIHARHTSYRTICPSARVHTATAAAGFFFPHPGQVIQRPRGNTGSRYIPPLGGEHDPEKKYLISLNILSGAYDDDPESMTQKNK